MRKLLTTGGIILAATLMARGAGAQVFTDDLPKLARSYSVWMARAFDQCSPATISVTTPMVPTGGCVPSHILTSDMNLCRYAKLTVGSNPARVRLLAVGCKCGSRIAVRLTLRVTKGGLNVKHPPGTNKAATFEDLTIICGPLPGPANGVANDSPNGYFTAISSHCNNAYPCPSASCGNVASGISLADCLGTSLKGLAGGGPANIEIRDAALLDRDNGDLPFMTPGILRN